MTVLHTGSTKKFSANWGDIFGGAKPAKVAKPTAKKNAKPAAKAGAAKAKSAKPAAAKKSKAKK